MNKKQYILIIAAIIAIAAYYFSDPKSTLRNLTKKTNKSQAITKSNPSLLDDQNMTREESESSDECINKLYEKSGAKKCDVNCFANYVRDKDPELALLIQENWEDQKAENRKPRSRIGKFYQAMMLGNIDLNRDERLKTDFSRSIAILRNLSEGEPENSYYLFFEALMLEQSGKKEEATEVLRRAVELPSYRSPFTEIHHRLLMATANDIKAYFKGVELYSSLPFPSYKKLGNLSKLDEEAFVAMGKKMMEPALAHQGKYFELTWNPIEYAMGKHLIEKVSPGEADKYPRYNELPEFDPGDFTGWDVGERGCHEEDLKEEIKKLLKEFAERS